MSRSTSDTVTPTRFGRRSVSVVRQTDRAQKGKHFRSRCRRPCIARPRRCAALQPEYPSRIAGQEGGCHLVVKSQVLEALDRPARQDQRVVRAEQHLVATMAAHELEERCGIAAHRIGRRVDEHVLVLGRDGDGFVGSQVAACKGQHRHRRAPGRGASMGGPLQVRLERRLVAEVYRPRRAATGSHGSFDRGKRGSQRSETPAVLITRA